MTSDKIRRDALNNQQFEDIYIHASQEPWIEWFPGIGLKMLRATQERSLDYSCKLLEVV